MHTEQLSLFKDFTTAEERNDAHTSAGAMLRDFVEQMDLQNIRLMLSNCETLADVSPDDFFAQLHHVFITMFMSSNPVLESAEGRCNRCHPGALAFIFRGINLPFHFSLLFHIKDDKVVDVHECVLLWKQFPELPQDFQILLGRPPLQPATSRHTDEEPPF
jgi:hypothetical protein